MADTGQRGGPASVVRSIDQMWDALEGEKPKWIASMLDSGSSKINLDVEEIAHQIPPGHGWIEEARELLKSNVFDPASQAISPEVAASEVDPPKPWIAVPGAFVVAASLAWLMHLCIVGAEPAIVLSLATTATALVFGRTPALVLSALSLLAYNLCIVPPELSFTIPSRIEVVYAMINIGISFAVPWLAQAPKRKPATESVTLELA